MPVETGLATYLTTLFDEWKKNREPLEKKWNRNLKIIKGEDVETWKVGEGDKWRSKTFIKVVKAKVFIAYSIIIDVFLQGGLVPFALKFSPFEEKRRQAMGAQDDESKSIDEMTDRIREQLTDFRADKEYQKKILSLAYYGRGYSKYTIRSIDIPGFRPSVVEDEDGNLVELPELPAYGIEKKQVPGHEYRSVWCIVSDPENYDLQKNRGTFEYSLICPYELRQKIGKRFYIEEAIKGVIAEASKQDTVEKDDTLPPDKREVLYRKSSIKWREFWGRAPRGLVEEFEKDSLGKDGVVSNPEWEEDIGDEVEVMVEMADDTIIRFVRREDHAKRPYKKCLWEESLDEDIGVSIADNMEGIQTSLNGMQRAFEDNKKLSGNVITATKRRFLSPNTPENITPGMNIEVSESCDDARKAIAPIVIPDVGKTLLDGLNLMEKWGDVVSQVPTIAQGFSLAKHKPDTLGEVQLMMQNLGKYFGMVIKNIDEEFTEPEIRDLYDYNMMDADYPGEKSDMTVHATGFTSFQNKVVVAQKIRELLALALSDRSGRIVREIKVRPHLEEIYKNMDVDVDKFLKTESEKQESDEKDRQAAEAARKAEEDKALRDAELKDKENEMEFQRDIIKEQVKEAAKA